VKTQNADYQAFIKMTKFGRFQPEKGAARFFSILASLFVMIFPNI